jgi:hypothetical protein
MRHRDQETVTLALEDWRQLRAKVEAEQGEQYEKPVLVKFLDSGTFEVMDRDIVEDEFYVLRKYKILRELDPTGRDLEAAIRESSRDQPQRKQGGKPTGRPGQRQGEQRQGGQRQGGQRQGGQRQGGQRPPRGDAPKQDGAKPEGKGPRRGSRRRGRRSGKRGGSGNGAAPPPAA